MPVIVVKDRKLIVENAVWSKFGFILKAIIKYWFGCKTVFPTSSFWLNWVQNIKCAREIVISSGDLAGSQLLSIARDSYTGNPNCDLFIYSLLISIR